MKKNDKERVSLAPANYWSLSFDSLITALKSNIEGLSAKEVEERQASYMVQCKLQPAT